MRLLFPTSRLGLVNGTCTLQLLPSRNSAQNLGVKRGELEAGPSSISRSISSSFASRNVEAEVVPAKAVPPSYRQHSLYLETDQTTFASLKSPNLKSHVESHKNWDQGQAYPLANTSAKSCNIRPWAFQQYLLQSAVSDTREIELLVDVPAYGRNYQLWLELLLFRERIRGNVGVWEVFQGMRSRQVDLPTEGVEAHSMWNALIQAAVALDRLETVWKYVHDLHIRTRQRYEGVYEILLETCFTRGSSPESQQHEVGIATSFESETWLKSAFKWHRRLGEIDLPPAGALGKMIPYALATRGGTKVFQRIYVDSNERDLYDRVMDELLSRARYEEALEWHRVFMARGDTPKLVSLADSLKRVPPYSTIRKSHHVSPSSSRSLQVRDESASAPGLSRKEEREAKVAEEATANDEFCARAFATKSVNPSLVMRNLATFGVTSMGALALQALARRCRDFVEEYHTTQGDKSSLLAEQLEIELKNLQSVGIDLEESKYSRLIKRLVSERNGHLLEVTIDSDQHPDVYDDRTLQQRLFESSLKSNNLTEALKTLKVLTFEFSEPVWASWNILLRACFRLPEDTRWSEITQVFEAMLEHSIPISRSTLRDSLFSLLNERNPSKMKGHATSSVDPLSFLTNMWIQILRYQRHPIEPELWKEIHKRFGMQGRFEELERLILFTAKKYAGQNSMAALRPSSNSGTSTPRALPSRRNIGKSRIDRLIPPVRQKAIIIWYFRSMVQSRRSTVNKKSEDLLESSSALSRVETWARGVALLQALKEYGLSVDTNTVRRACRLELLNMHTPRIFDSESAKLMRQQKGLSLRYNMSYLQYLWRPAGALFAVSDEELRYGNPRHMNKLSVKALFQREPLTEFYKYQDYGPAMGQKGRRVSKKHSLLPAKLAPLKSRLKGFSISMHFRPQSREEALRRSRDSEWPPTFDTKNK